EQLAGLVERLHPAEDLPGSLLRRRVRLARTSGGRGRLRLRQPLRLEFAAEAAQVAALGLLAGLALAVALELLHDLCHLAHVSAPLSGPQQGRAIPWPRHAEPRAAARRRPPTRYRDRRVRHHQVAGVGGGDAVALGEGDDLLDQLRLLAVDA